MNDTVDRQLAIDMVHKNYDAILDFSSDGRTIADSFEDIINSLPPAQPMWWIPCSERMPEKYGQYLVTFIPSGGTLWTCALIARYSDLMGISKPSFYVGTVGKDDFMNITEQVIAWMPLPQPYKGGQNG